MKLKIAATILIIAAGLAGSYFILKNSFSKQDVSESVSAENGADDFAKISSDNWFETVSNKISSEINNLKEGKAEVSGSLPVDGSFNFTKAVAKTVFENMKGVDQEGRNPFEGELDPNDPEAKKLIESALAELDYSKIFDVAVLEGDVKISGDNSNDKKAEYIRSYGEIIIKNISGPYGRPDLALKKMTETGDASDVKKVADIYSDIYNKISEISTPPDYVGLHKKYLGFLKKARLVYGGVADFQNDPVKSQVLFRYIPDIAEEEFNIKKEYSQKASEIKL